MSRLSDMRILQKGTRVRVPGGTRLLYDTSPNAERPLGKLKRAQTVTVHWMTHAPDTIYWAGAGGYWKGVELTDEMEVLR